MSRLKLCVCVFVVLWGDELEYVWLGYSQQISACFFLSLSFILFFAYIVDDGSDVHIVVFVLLKSFIALWHLSVNDHTGKQYATLTQPQPIRNIKNNLKYSW